MLDRMSLSIKNGWFDEQNRAYIVYSIENMMDDLGCSKPTCVKIVKELDSEKGIGLHIGQFVEQLQKFLNEC